MKANRVLLLRGFLSYFTTTTRLRGWGDNFRSSLRARAHTHTHTFLHVMTTKKLLVPVHVLTHSPGPVPACFRTDQNLLLTQTQHVPALLSSPTQLYAPVSQSKPRPFTTEPITTQEGSQQEEEMLLDPQRGQSSLSHVRTLHVNECEARKRVSPEETDPRRTGFVQPAPKNPDLDLVPRGLQTGWGCSGDPLCNKERNQKVQSTNQQTAVSASSHQNHFQL